MVFTKKVILSVLFFVVLVSVLLGWLGQRNGDSRSFFPVEGNVGNDFPVNVILQITGYEMDGVVDNNILEEELGRAGLWPLTSLQFIGEVGEDGVRSVDGLSRRISPDSVEIVVKGTEDYSADLAVNPVLENRLIETVVSGNGDEVARFVAGEFEGNVLRIPLYINLEQAASFGEREINFLNENIILALFMNFQSIAFYNEGDIFEEFSNVYGELGRPFLRVVRG